MAGNMSQLSVKNLCKSYPTPKEPLEVLDNVSFEMEDGESLAILGPSGSGKSTLLHLLGTLDRPTSGSIRYGSIDPFTLDEVQLADFRHRHVGFVFQEHFLLPQLSVLENVLLPILAQQSITAADQSRARQSIARVGLDGRQGHLPSELSGGERQRVAIARAMIMRPRVILADEPTGNLDQQTAREIIQLLMDSLKDSAASLKLLIMVTHNPELARLLSRRACMENKQLVEQQ